MPRLSSPLLIGRTRELQVLRAALESSLRAQPRVVLLGGEAGVGKTRLLTELRTLAESQGIRVLSGVCVDFGEGGMPFGPVVQALRPVLRESEPKLRELVGPARSELARILPELAQDGAPLPTDPADEFAQARLFELLLRLLDRLSQDAPTVFIVEDLHWADASTREFFAFAARNLPRTTLLLVGSYRTDELHRRHPLRRYLTELERSGLVERLDLKAFSRREFEAQVSAILDRELDRPLLDAVFARSEGNAFFTEELLSAEEMLSPEARATGRTLPPTLHDVLLQRVERLSEPAQELLRVAAVAGVRVDQALIVAALGDELSGRLREAVEHNVLLPEDDAAGGSYAFRHALLQEAIYEDLLPGERTRLHRAVAEALSSVRESRARTDASLVAQLAHHWDRAGRPREALAASVEAARVAASGYAFPEALAHVERALTLWDQVPEAEDIVGHDWVTLATRAAEAAVAAGEHRRAVALLQAALGAVDPIADPLRAGETRALLARQLHTAGEREAADALIQEAVRLVPAVPRTRERATVLVAASFMLLFASRYREVVPLGEEALAAARASGVARAIADALIVIGVATAFLGDVEGGRSRLLEAKRVGVDEGSPATLATVYLHLGIILEASGRFEETVEVISEGLDLMDQLGMSRVTEGILESKKAEALRRLGRWGEADRVLGDALTRKSTRWEVGIAHATRANLFAAMGRFDEAEREAQAAWDAYGAIRSTGFAGQHFSARAELALWRGEPNVAQEQVRHGLARLEGTDDMRWIGHLSWLGVRAAADRAQQAAWRRNESDVRSATELANRLMEDLRAGAQKCVEERTIFAREVAGPLALAEAEVSRLEGKPDAGLWELAADTWRDLGQPYPVAYARYREAEALLAAGAARGEAGPPLRHAYQLVIRLGAVPLRHEVESLARRARVDVYEEPPQGSPGERAEARADTTLLDAYGLTPREREVLALLADGRSDQEIANALFISAKTASVHVTNIKSKLGVETRLEAGTLALRLQLVPEHPGVRSRLSSGPR